MRKVLLIAWRDYSEAVKSKGFLIGIALMPVLMFGGIAVTTLMQGKVDTNDQRFTVVDRSAVLGGLLAKAAEKRNATGLTDKEGKKVQPAYLLEVVPPQGDVQVQRLELSNEVREGKIHAFLEIGAAVMDPDAKPEAGRIQYYSDRAALDDAKAWFTQAAAEAVQAVRLKGAGIDPVALQRVMRPLSVEGVGLLSVDEKTGQVTGG